MNNTALGAKKVLFISEAHENFYNEKLNMVRYKDVYHKALIYCLGMNAEARSNVERIYDFETGCVNTKCLSDGWQTSGSKKVVRMAINLYCNGTPSTEDYKKPEDKLEECKVTRKTYSERANAESNLYLSFFYYRKPLVTVTKGVREE